MPLTERVESWRRLGEEVEFRGRRIHLYRRPGTGPLLVLLHGFPSSSYDWRFLLERETGRAVLAPDFLGFGLSDKPRDHTYGLHWQADLVEELVGRYGGSERVFLVAHDMGTSVATELFARDIEGRLEMDIAGAVLFNGSMLQHLANLTLAQRLLLSRGGPLVARLSSNRFFRQQFGSIFSEGHPLSDEEAEDQWGLISHNGGRTLGNKLIHYYRDRFEFADRWHGALREWPKPLTFLWGMQDPVAGPKMLAALRELRPQAPVTELPDLGHYPQIESPEAFTQALLPPLSAAL